ncbi:MAG TPA: hypothetical protein VGI70_18735, partial [Polyangiales bacterium]
MASDALDICADASREFCSAPPLCFGALDSDPGVLSPLADSAASANARKADAPASDAQKAAAKQLADRSQRFEDEVKKLQDRLDKDN